jgi:hypothetical protein
MLQAAEDAGTAVSGAVSNPAGAAGDSAEAAKGFLGGIWTKAQEAAEKAQAAALEAAETAKKVPPLQHHLAYFSPLAPVHGTGSILGEEAKKRTCGRVVSAAMMEHAAVVAMMLILIGQQHCVSY